MSHMPTTPNYAGAVSGGINTAFNTYSAVKGLQRAEDQYERDTEEYNYKRGLRPIQEKLLNTQVEDAEITLEDNRRKAEKEGMLDAMKLLNANRPDKALELYNKSGKDRVSKWYKHPDDPDQELWIVEEPDGNNYTIRPNDILKQFNADSEATKKKKSANVEYLKYVADNVFDGDVEKAFNAISTSKTKDAQEVRLALYKSILSKNPYLEPKEVQKIVDGAVNYVTQGSPGSSSGGGGITYQDALGRAEKEAEDDLGILDYIPFVNPDQRKITERADELMRGGGGISPSNEPVSTPQALPKEAIQQLKSGVVTTFRNGQKWTLRNGQPVRVE